jgi:hypothetical protein
MPREKGNNRQTLNRVRPHEVAGPDGNVPAAKNAPMQRVSASLSLSRGSQCYRRCVNDRETLRGWRQRVERAEFRRIRLDQI